jgi:hypothetical protein
MYFVRSTFCLNLIEFTLINLQSLTHGLRFGLYRSSFFAAIFYLGVVFGLRRLFLGIRILLALFFF